jgi:hypothetical protein
MTCRLSVVSGCAEIKAPQPDAGAKPTDPERRAHHDAAQMCWG